jgi:hypothetical protein
MFCRGSNFGYRIHPTVLGGDRVNPLSVSRNEQIDLSYQSALLRSSRTFWQRLSTRRFHALIEEFTCKLLPSYSPNPLLHEVLQATNG